MLLENKNAVIYGGAGSIGSAVARAFGREGANVFLVGRTIDTLDAVAEEIRADGGKAETAVVDALDEKQVEEHAAIVDSEAGSLDISWQPTARMNQSICSSESRPPSRLVAMTSTAVVTGPGGPGRMRRAAARRGGDG